MPESLKVLPEPVARRLPRYLIAVRELHEKGELWVSSVTLAKVLSLTSSTVRQDLSHLDLIGVAKRGYETQKLLEVLRSELGGDRVHRVVIVGAGFLGSAIALHGALARQGFEVCSIVDNNPEIIGTQVGGLKIRPATALQQIVQEQRIEMGIIAVPASEAQKVAEQLVDAGVKGLLNLALVQLEIPESIAVLDARIVVGLQELAYTLRTMESAGSNGS